MIGAFSNFINYPCYIYSTSFAQKSTLLVLTSVFFFLVCFLGEIWQFYIKEIRKILNFFVLLV